MFVSSQRQEEPLIEMRSNILILRYNFTFAFLLPPNPVLSKRDAVMPRDLLIIFPRQSKSWIFWLG
jgi:hypothetical protein